MSYVPGLIVEQSTVIRKERELPIPGRSLVKVGDIVTPAQAVLSAEIPGEIVILKLADRLGTNSEKACASLKIVEGQSVSVGTQIAELRYLFGLLRDEVISPCEGNVEYILSSMAHVGLRQPSKLIQLSAYIPGRVIEVEEGKRVSIEMTGAFIQGIFGIGGERNGQLLILDVPRAHVVQPTDLPSDVSGTIVVGGSSFSADAIETLGRGGAVGIVTASISSGVLTQILGKPLGVSMTGDEDIPSTLIITEGFGALEMSERTLSILRQHQGQNASISGATQVRAGAMRPEILISNNCQLSISSKTSLGLIPGSTVRCIRAPYFGMFGKVISLPSEPTLIESGAVVRVAGIELANGAKVLVPRANLELSA